MEINKRIDEAVRDITAVGVCPAPKSKVREIVKKTVWNVLDDMRKEGLLVQVNNESGEIMTLIREEVSEFFGKSLGEYEVPMQKRDNENLNKSLTK